MSARTKGEAMKRDSKTAELLGVQGARLSGEIRAELLKRAEKELAAFVGAVRALHGEEQTRAAADDWLLELTALKGLCKSTSRDLRSVTVRAARRLTQRLSIPSPAAIQSSARLVHNGHGSRAARDGAADRMTMCS